MKTQICPKCGEENPGESVMCWACYTPLGAGRASAPAPLPADETPLGAKVKRWLFDAAPFAAMAGLAASGWLPQRARWPVLGACVTTIAGTFAEQKLSERKNRRLTEGIEDDEPPVVRIAQTILLYASKENATAIRLTENGKGFRVEYQIEGEWREQMRIPLYIWRPLRQLLLEYVRQGAVQFNHAVGLSPAKSAFRLDLLSANLETDATGETLELQFESAPPKPGETLPDWAPDKRCKCGEINAPGAVWCWNCYAPLEEQQTASYFKENASNIAVITELFALGSSGWWPRRARPFVLGAGALGLAAAFAWCPLQERFKDFNIERNGSGKSEAPVELLVSQILERAWENGAAQIILRERGGVAVTFADEGEERATMNLPPYTWLALRGRLLQIARGGVCEVNGQKRYLSAELRSDVNGENLELRFDAIQ